MSIAIAILPPLAAGGIAAAASSVPAIAGGAAVLVAGVAALAVVLGRDERSPDTARVLRAALTALLVRLVGGGAIVLAAVTLVPDHAAVVAGVTGGGLAGSALLHAGLGLWRQEATRV